jgi:hypothetical protein
MVDSLIPEFMTKLAKERPQAARRKKAAKPEKPSETAKKKPIRSLSRHRVIPMRRSKLLHLLIDAKSKGEPVIVCVDTGAAGCVIASECSAKFQITAISTPQREIGGLGSAEVMADTALCQDLDLAGFAVSEIKVMITSLAHVHAYLKKVGEEPYDMILGCDFLIGHKAVMDCAAAKLWLHPKYQEPVEARQMTELSAMPTEVAAATPEGNDETSFGAAAGADGGTAGRLTSNDEKKETNDDQG